MQAKLQAVCIETLRLYVHGLKVKAQQGQHFRFMAYAAEDTHSLVAALVNRLSALPYRKLDIRVAKAGNFTAEVQRLARALWPEHSHAITATCFRHQWSADVKSTGDADAASRGLGTAALRPESTTARRIKHGIGMPCAPCELRLTYR